ncbi:MAG TPA: hypothetical protein VMF11_15915 [Candidatus Baltobacteraceae bacterium]|nr:hypothetical protein [Candidatus Baltobacteraceae bacterium]
MKVSILRSTLAAVALAGVLSASLAAPAKADTGTTNTILGILAGVAAVATVENVAHKDAVANTVEGYTRDGSTVYEDGHVVAPNGYSWYPGNQGQSISCNDGSCVIYGNNGWQNRR